MTEQEIHEVVRWLTDHGFRVVAIEGTRVTVELDPAKDP